MSHGLGSAVRKARETMNWPLNAAAQAAYVSNKSWGDLENANSSGVTGSSERKILSLLEAYGFTFSADYTELVHVPGTDDRYFLTIDLRYTDNPDSVAEEMERELRAIGYCVVVKRNYQRVSGSKYDAIVVQVPPLNVVPLRILLEKFVDRFGSVLHSRVRDRRNLLLSKETLPKLFDS